MHGFTIVSLANNHVLDYREKGLSETMKLLTAHGLRFCGAGLSLEAASRPAIMTINEVTLGFVARCEVIIDSPFYAGEHQRGIAPLDLQKLEHDIGLLRTQVDVVIVSLHWGSENRRYPSREQVATARGIIDMGAHLVIGHHPHVLQGVERYKHGFIAYSLGNFLFSDITWTWTDAAGNSRNSEVRMSRANRLSMMLSVDIGREGVRGVQLIPCRIGRDLRSVPDQDGVSFRAKMWLLSRPITMEHYPLFAVWYHRVAGMRAVLANNFRRMRKIHKLRPHHIGELLEHIRDVVRGFRRL